MAQRKTTRSKSPAKKGTPRGGAKKKATSAPAKPSPTKTKSKPKPKTKAKAVTKKTPRKPAVRAKQATTKKTATKKTTTKKTAAKPAAKKKAKLSVKGSGVKAGTPARPVRRTTKRAAVHVPEEPSTVVIGGLEIAPRDSAIPKTKLTAKQLRTYKELLLKKRRELLGDVTQLSSEALRSNRQESRGDLSNMPSHMADVGSDNWEQEFTLDLIATERALLSQIDASLERIRKRTYGVCVATHRMISLERLEAKPWAQYCIEFARLRDSGRIPPGLI
ncbi:MAG: TraR/DksA family transcriptional regulator [bacterium]|nr:TraR/DksA family transcriptional regulator [bacterium]